MEFIRGVIMIKLSFMDGVLLLSRNLRWIFYIMKGSFKMANFMAGVF
jgi:hypothetical protein